MSFFDPDAAAAGGLHAERFTLRPLRAADAAIDHAAVMDTREDLRVWEQSAWPTDDFTVDANREDLQGLEERHDAGRAFTYAVLDPSGTESLGCVYGFPTDASFLSVAEVMPLTDAAWADVDAVVYFWVRGGHQSLEAPLLAELRRWFREDWGFERIVFVTSEPFTRQRSLFVDAGLEPQFALREPEKQAGYVVHG
jgi:hypothetical protein